MAEEEDNRNAIDEIEKLIEKSLVHSGPKCSLSSAIFSCDSIQHPENPRCDLTLIKSTPSKYK